jgi:hypothetical protein
LPAGLLPIWFLAGIWLLPAQAQLHELPPSTPAPQTLPYDTNPKGRTLGSSALPSDPYGGPSRSGRADAASQLRDPYVLSSPERTAPGLYPPGTTSSAEPAGPGATQRFFDANTAASQPLYYGYGCCWTWQLLPDGLMYKSYLAGGKEPRFGTEWVYQRGHGWVWDAALGGRVGVLRLGTQNDFWPEGWQLDFEGATFPRLDLVPEHDRDLISADFRVGVPLTSRRGPWEGKFGYYHISAHLGDEFMLTHPGVERVKYVRDSLLLGIALRPHPDWRLYWETACAFNTDGGAKPWEFQFGAEYSETEPTGASGAPFIAANGHLRQENNFSGNFVLQTGWQWRGRGGHLVRVGAHYFNGFSDQYQFFKQREDQIGVGMWYDF